MKSNRSAIVPLAPRLPSLGVHAFPSSSTAERAQLFINQGSAVHVETTTTTIQLPTGVQLNVAQRGPATGRAVLMLHGYSDSWQSFSRVLPLLAPDMRVIVPDQRGHGDSDRPAKGYEIDDFATDALQLMDALGVQKATVVGHSMGTLVARRLAERASERVERLVLVNGTLSVHNDVVAQLRQDVSELSDPVDPNFVREFQMSTIALPVPDAFMEQAQLESRKLPARVWRDAMSGMWNDRPAAHHITCPTIVLAGDKDAVFSVAEQEALAAAIPGATFTVIRGTGHALPWEDPKALADVLR